MTPYDWQESISRRAEYAESRLTGGLPAAAVSLPNGVLIAALKRQSQKVFEIYDHLAMSALGAQADVEALRVAAIEFCHREGYQRSSDDVTLKRLINGVSESVRRSFSDLRSTPLVAKALFAEIGSDPGHDRFYVLDYDGDFSESRGFASLVGKAEVQKDLDEALRQGAWPDHDSAMGPVEAALRKAAPEGEFVFEAALLSRRAWSDRRLHWLTPSPLL
jgi:proteasome alpha subunit